MKTHRILLAAVLTAGAVGAVAVTTALATPSSGLASQLLGRGTAQDAFEVVQGDSGRERGALVGCAARDHCDVAVVRATLDPNGFTGWHSHPMASLVVVRTGTLRMVEVSDGRCSARTFTAGQAFIHPAGVHNFVNAGGEQLEFLVAYFAPRGAGLLIDSPAPAECS